MCRYAQKTYKSHYVCFQCRKSFKQPDVDDILRRIKKEKIYHEPDGGTIRKVGHIFTNRKTSGLFTKNDTEELRQLASEIENRTIKCPECGNIMADLGKDFKAPKKTAVKEWEIIESLFKTGKCFHTCGCYGMGYIPQTSREHEVYLKTILESYQKSLAFCQNKTIEEYTDKMEEINYWSERINKIKDEINHQQFKIV
ncbi:hypothetical protein SAMN05421542_3288 [Chryseobacterium jejuense]|uniref:Uncharacterized protein n=1 Tax=Chryseobacterium jejuense TaxID=445960 RepID=A0A2X2X6N7_CHRJE|nr:hypothetical protein SAMN05421542_3288 [Chryseobacterium jejuense]SQB45793.1 Uncharacterised protein [Chryseobacterium jejuense]